MKIVWLAMLLALIGIQISFAMPTEEKQCVTNGIAYQQAKVFVQTLKTALKKSDKQKVAQLIDYPLRVNKHNPKMKKIITYYIKTPHQFLDQYHALFPPEKVKDVINDNTIFCNYRGAMLAGGFIWFDGTKIFSMNI